MCVRLIPVQKDALTFVFPLFDHTAAKYADHRFGIEQKARSTAVSTSFNVVSSSALRYREFFQRYDRGLAFSFDAGMVEVDFPVSLQLNSSFSSASFRGSSIAWQR